MRRDKREAEKGALIELHVPLDALPPLVGTPPVAGEGEWPVGGVNGTAMGTGEDGEWIMAAVAGFGSEVDPDGRPEPFQGKGGGRAGVPCREPDDL